MSLRCRPAAPPPKTASELCTPGEGTRPSRSSRSRPSLSFLSSFLSRLRHKCRVSAILASFGLKPRVFFLTNATRCAVAVNTAILLFRALEPRCSRTCRVRAFTRSEFRPSVPTPRLIVFLYPSPVRLFAVRPQVVVTHIFRLFVFRPSVRRRVNPPRGRCRLIVFFLYFVVTSTTFALRNLPHASTCFSVRPPYIVRTCQPRRVIVLSFCTALSRRDNGCRT